MASKRDTGAQMNGTASIGEDSRCIERLAGEQSEGTLEQRANGLVYGLVAAVCRFVDLPAQSVGSGRRLLLSQSVSRPRAKGMSFLLFPPTSRLTHLK